MYNASSKEECSQLSLRKIYNNTRRIYTDEYIDIQYMNSPDKTTKSHSNGLTYRIPIERDRLSLHQHLANKKQANLNPNRFHENSNTTHRHRLSEDIDLDALHSTSRNFKKKVFPFSNGLVEVLFNHKKNIPVRAKKNQLMINIVGNNEQREYEFKVGKEKNKYDGAEHHSVDQASGAEELPQDKYKFERVFEVVRSVWTSINEIAAMHGHVKSSFQSTISSLLRQSRSTQTPSALIPVFNFYREVGPLKSSPRLKLSYLMASLFSGGRDGDLLDLLYSMFEGYMAGREESIIGENVKTYIDQMHLISKLDLVLAFECERLAAALRTYVNNRREKAVHVNSDSIREKIGGGQEWEGREAHVVTRGLRNGSSGREDVDLFDQLYGNSSVLEMLVKTEGKCKTRFGISKEDRLLNRDNWMLLSKIKELTVKREQTKKRFQVLRGQEYFLSDEYKPPVV